MTEYDYYYHDGVVCRYDTGNLVAGEVYLRGEWHPYHDPDARTYGRKLSPDQTTAIMARETGDGATNGSAPAPAAGAAKTPPPPPANKP